MIEEEVEALRSIYGHELVVENSSQLLRMKIRPQPTMSNIYCVASVEAVIELSKEYPKASPKVHLRQPRGIDENNLNILSNKIEQYLEANTDMPILYDIFQMIQEFLETEQNFPCAVCPICLRSFNAEIASVCLSNCGHYIHQNCFVSYINYSKDDIKRELSEWPDDMKSKVDQVLKCPMCRMPLDEEDLLAVEKIAINLVEADTSEADFEFNWEEWRAKLRELQPIYERQKAKGGLIDLEEERKRNLITEETVLERQTTVESSQHGESGEVTESVKDQRNKT